MNQRMMGFVYVHSVVAVSRVLTLLIVLSSMGVHESKLRKPRAAAVEGASAAG